MFDQQCALGTNLCLEEAIWLRIYLPNFKSDQNWNRNHTETFSEKNESQRIVIYNLTETTLMFLWFLRWQKRSTPPLQLWRIRKTENRGIQKLTLHHSYLSKWQNSKSSEFLNISFTSAPCWLRYNQREVLLISLKSFFCSITTLDNLCLAINSERNFSYLHSMFPCGQNYANLC